MNETPIQPSVSDPSSATVAPQPNTQYVQRSPARTAVLLLGLSLLAFALVWLTLGRPISSSGSAGEYDAPAPVGAPLRAPRASASTANGESGATTQPAVPLISVAADTGDYTPIIFDALAAFDYDPYMMLDVQPGDDPPPEQIPPAVKALNGRRVAVQGYMVPVQMVKEDVRYFLLVRNQMLCCFGVAVGMNEWIYISMKEGGNARYVQDVPVMVYGTLHVGEELRDGMVMSIYRMDGEKMTVKGGF